MTLVLAATHRDGVLTVSDTIYRRGAYTGHTEKVRSIGDRMIMGVAGALPVNLDVFYPAFSRAFGRAGPYTSHSFVTKVSSVGVTDSFGQYIRSKGKGLRMREYLFSLIPEDGIPTLVRFTPRAAKGLSANFSAVSASAIGRFSPDRLDTFASNHDPDQSVDTLAAQLLKVFDQEKKASSETGRPLRGLQIGFLGRQGYDILEYETEY